MLLNQLACQHYSNYQMGPYYLWSVYQRTSFVWQCWHPDTLYLDPCGILRLTRGPVCYPWTAQWFCLSFIRAATCQYRGLCYCQDSLHGRRLSGFLDCCRRTIAMGNWLNRMYFKTWGLCHQSLTFSRMKEFSGTHCFDYDDGLH